MTADGSADLTALVTAFSELTGHAPEGVWAAPGRVNLIGEHTDYNDGFVLPLALPQRCRVAAARSYDRTSLLSSVQAPGQVVEIDAATVVPGEVTGWAAYAAGMLWALRKGGYDVPQVSLVLDSDVPIGAGLSSSAAIECAVGVAVTGLIGADADPTELALLAQRAENEFVGAPTGIMDQMASMHGRAGHVVFIDTRTRACRPVPFDLGPTGLALLVVDTNAPHALVEGAYGERRRTCEDAAATLGLTALRELSADALEAALSRLPDELSRRRVRHVVTENDRVLRVVATLESGADPRSIGPLLTASHASLRDDFEVTVPHLDVAVDAELAAGAYGARMTGGGFGGSIIALVDADRVEVTSAAVAETFAARGFGRPASFPAVPAAGAGRVG